ncbi:hypothetical protein FOZ60_005828, partial [Perkinsus olseni]
AAGLNGKYCGNLYGQDFSVDFESGRATLSVLGQTAGCDYEVDGTDIEFSNYDAILQKLMDMFHINKIQGASIEYIGGEHRSRWFPHSSCPSMSRKGFRERQALQTAAVRSVAREKALAERNRT